MTIDIQKPICYNIAMDIKEWTCSECGEVWYDKEYTNLPVKPIKYVCPNCRKDYNKKVSWWERYL